jgi:hypothetical protein
MLLAFRKNMYPEKADSGTENLECQRSATDDGGIGSKTFLILDDLCDKESPRVVDMRIVSGGRANLL